LLTITRTGALTTASDGSPIGIDAGLQLSKDGKSQTGRCWCAPAFLAQAPAKFRPRRSRADVVRM
jgi:hypothetical protein